MRARGRKGVMRKLLVGLAATGTGTMLIAVPASAAPPERALPPEEVQGARTLDNCGFDLRIEFTGKEAVIDFGDRFISSLRGRRRP